MTDAVPPSTAVPQVTCGSCRFWVQASATDDSGECRAAPPVVVYMQTKTPFGVAMAPVPMFPRTRPEIWCGQYKSRLLGAQM